MPNAYNVPGENSTPLLRFYDVPVTQLQIPRTIDFPIQ
jgi:hypothetical protein